MDEFKKSKRPETKKNRERVLVPNRQHFFSFWSISLTIRVKDQGWEWNAFERSRFAFCSAVISKERFRFHFCFGTVFQNAFPFRFSFRNGFGKSVAVSQSVPERNAFRNETIFAFRRKISFLFLSLFLSRRGRLYIYFLSSIVFFSPNIARTSGPDQVVLA